MIEQMSARLRGRKTFESAIEVILDDVIALHGAEFGDVQLPIGDDELIIVAQRGLVPAFLEAFRRVKKSDGCASGRAWRSGRSIVIRDVQKDDAYALFRRDAKRAGYRAVQSTPLIAKDGTLLGMVSTLFASPHAPTSIEMDILKVYSNVAADYLHELLGKQNLAHKAEQMGARLFEIDMAAPPLRSA